MTLLLIKWLRDDLAQWVEINHLLICIQYSADLDLEDESEKNKPFSLSWPNILIFKSLV